MYDMPNKGSEGEAFLHPGYGKTSAFCIPWCNMCALQQQKSGDSKPPVENITVAVEPDVGADHLVSLTVAGRQATLPEQVPDDGREASQFGCLEWEAGPAATFTGNCSRSGHPVLQLSLIHI